MIFAKNRRLVFLFSTLFLLASCAKRGRPSGGPKDMDAPLYVTADPPYESINFNSKEIKIEFNEYITLKDLTKQLVISPPLKEVPLITPQGTPSKYIRVKILDTLLENTTYTFDFGKSVQDNNEGNQLEKFKYVFSTGSYLDSLSIKGSVKDAFESKTENSIKLLLFKADSTYNDSLIYKAKPNYVSSTLDTTLFEFTNLAPGKYHLFALQDKNSDYIFQPKFDKIGFLDSLISLPRDSIISKTISLFQELLPYEFVRAKEESKGKIGIGFRGSFKSLELTPLSEVSSDFRSMSKFEKDSDTLNFWFHNYAKDSIVLLIKSGEILDTTTVKLKKKQLDSLVVTQQTKGYLEFKDTLFFSTNNPIVSIDTSKIELFDKDTIKVSPVGFNSSTENKVGLIFDKKLEQVYRLKVLPNAFTDIYGFTNDTIQSGLRTRKLEDYGDLTFSIDNANNKNLIIQLLTERNQLIAQQRVNTSDEVVFDYLRPGKTKLRIFLDRNGNNQWDTGNLLKKIKPEPVYYEPKVFEIRPNWSLNENIVVEQIFKNQ